MQMREHKHLQCSKGRTYSSGYSVLTCCVDHDFHVSIEDGKITEVCLGMNHVLSLVDFSVNFKL